MSTFALLGALGLLAGAASAADAPPPLIIDTDSGIDDLLAISYLLSVRDVRIEAITTVHGLTSPGRGAANIRTLLRRAKHNIPVFEGSHKPLRRAVPFPKDWRTFAEDTPARILGADSAGASGENAAAFLTNTLRNRSQPVSLLCLGPLTNIAALLQSMPAAREHISRLTIMGGAVHVPGNLGDGEAYKTTNTAAEWNIFADPDAAAAVFESGIPIVMVPLDATNAVPITAAFVRQVRGRGSVLGKVVAGLLQALEADVQAGTYYAWDPLAAVAVVAPDILRASRGCVKVVRRGSRAGQTVFSPDPACRVEAALGADARRFEELFAGAF